MKKNISLLVVLIMTIILYFSLGDINIENKEIFYIKLILLIILLPLIYINIKNILKEISLLIKEVLENIHSDKNEIVLKINSLEKENQDLRLSNNKIFEEMMTYFKESQNYLLETIESFKNNISNEINILQNNTINLLNSVEEMSSKLQNNINSLVDIEKKFIEELDIDIKKINGLYDDLKKNIEKNICDLAYLLKEEISEFDEKIEENFKENIEDLSREINKCLKSIKNENIKFFGNLEEFNNNQNVENSKAISELKNKIIEITNLHNEILVKFDENQNKLLELNKEDISIMKDLLR